MLVTFGIYAVYWMYTRTQKLDPLIPQKPIGRAFSLTATLLYLLNILVSGIQGAYEATLGENLVFALFSGILSLVSLILLLVWYFNFRGGLNLLLGEARKLKGVLSVLGTLFLGPIYFQYCINEAIDQGRK